MEGSRLNITREKPPAVVFRNRSNAFIDEAIVGKSIQLEVELKVVEQSRNMDDNGNEIIKYKLEIVSAKAIS